MPPDSLRYREIEPVKGVESEVMFIIFGASEKGERVGGGQFQCPVCKTTQSYVLMQGRRYFSLFFIPVVPLDRTGEYVVCDGCKSKFDPRVL